MKKNKETEMVHKVALQFWQVPSSGGTWLFNLIASKFPLRFGSQK